MDIEGLVEALIRGILGPKEPAAWAAEGVVTEKTVKAAKAQGRGVILVGKHRVTPLARDAAKELGVTLKEGRP